MDKRHLASLEVSAIGLGCMGLSANYGEPVDTDHGVSLGGRYLVPATRRTKITTTALHHYQGLN